MRIEFELVSAVRRGRAGRGVSGSFVLSLAATQNTAGHVLHCAGRLLVLVKWPIVETRWMNVIVVLVLGPCRCHDFMNHKSFSERDHRSAQWFSH